MLVNHKVCEVIHKLIQAVAFHPYGTKEKTDIYADDKAYTVNDQRFLHALRMLLYGAVPVKHVAHEIPPISLLP